MPEHVRVAQTDDEVWMVFMNSEPNNQLTAEFIGQLNGALDNVEQQWKDAGSKGGALVITSQIPKSFSSGIAEADAKDAKFLNEVFEPLKTRLLTYPLVTIAAINGDALGAGFLLALLCDHRTIHSSKGTYSLQNAVLGHSIPDILKVMMKDAAVAEDTVAGKVWSTDDLYEAGLVEEVIDNGGMNLGMLGERSTEIASEKGEAAADGKHGKGKLQKFKDVLSKVKGKL